MHVFGTPKLFLTPPNSPPCTIHFKGQEIKHFKQFSKTATIKICMKYTKERWSIADIFLDISATTDYDRESNLHN